MDWQLFALIAVAAAVRIVWLEWRVRTLEAAIDRATRAIGEIVSDAEEREP